MVKRISTDAQQSARHVADAMMKRPTDEIRPIPRIEAIQATGKAVSSSYNPKDLHKVIPFEPNSPTAKSTNKTIKVSQKTFQTGIWQ